MRQFSRMAFGLALVLASLAESRTSAHTGHLPSVHDTVAGVVQRLAARPHTVDGRSLSRRRAERLLTAEEREVLATGHLSFHADQPVRVTVFHDRALGRDPFWLRRGGWRRLPGIVRVGDARFDRWQRDFAAGHVGLGVNSLGGGGRHYFVTVANLGAGPLALEELYPGQVRTNSFRPGVAVWADREDKIESVTEGEAGSLLIQTLHARRDDGRLAGRLQRTLHPATAIPDQVVLTWSGDPRTTQTIQWRTSTRAAAGRVRYAEAPGDEAWHETAATTEVLVTPTTANDPVVHRHTAELTGLRPSTTYRYQVGDGTSGGWGEAGEFTTAPADPVPFAFVYMGDAQNGLEAWGRLVRGAHRARPDAAFYLMAGDLVNRGNERDDWDDFFRQARGVFDHRPLVPVLGNHECQGGHPRLYLSQFHLPRNGPSGLEAERVYRFEYGNALFLVLDSNLPPESQTAWLEEQLANSRARWKFVAYHHPAYSSARNRDNKKLRELWTPIFERHGVDLALQGHDHAYLRTHPMRGGQPAPSPAEGTTYVVSVSGTKFYPQADRPETVVGFTNVATWQILDLQIDGDRLTYRACDRDGRVRDAFVIDKSVAPPGTAGGRP